MNKPKKQSLEEFIDSQPYYGHCTPEYLEGIEVGAKWQEEQAKEMEEKIRVNQNSFLQFLETEKKLDMSDVETIERIEWYFNTFLLT